MPDHPFWDGPASCCNPFLDNFGFISLEFTQIFIYLQLNISINSNDYSSMTQIYRTAMMALLGVSMAFCAANAEKLVILHTNDTHSNIDVSRDGKGGILPRKAIIDSVRKAEKNVLLIDAGDMVQGTLYFNLYKGDVEYPLFNMMDYDVRILGNHEFDNGLEELARHWKDVRAEALSANYDFTGTAAEGLFKPYTIKEIGGKRIGIMGLNVSPERLIMADNYAGMKFSDPISTANRLASELKHKKKCDLVVAVTHIGYEEEDGKPTDVDLARSSRDIDIIIGGHSHTFIDPSKPEKYPYLIPNKDGKSVLVAQTGRYGQRVGYIKLDLNKKGAQNYIYSPIEVTDRFAPEEYDSRMREFISPFKAKVDSINNLVVGWSDMDMNNYEHAGAYPNWAADMALWTGTMIADSLRQTHPEMPGVDIGFLNIGGIRQPIRRGPVTQGEIKATFPFANYFQIVRMKGRDFIETMKLAAQKGGEGVSRDVKVVCDSLGNVEHVLYNNLPMEEDKDYVVCTINYLTLGNDGYYPMTRHEVLWTDGVEMSERVLDYVGTLERYGQPIAGDTVPRFIYRRQ